MGRQSIGISFQNNEVYECGAQLLAVLAHPVDDKNDNRRADIHASLCRYAIEFQYLSNPDDWRPKPVKLPYVFRDAKTAGRETKFTAKRLGERLVAARMAIPFFQKSELGEAPTLPKAIKPLSLNKMAVFVLDDAGQSDAGNVKRRYWAPSRPVIHLAASAAVIGQALKKAGVPLCFEHLLICRELVELIVQRAQAYEELIARDPAFPVKADELIKVRMV
ncbi:MAG: hypothetical protein ACLPX9_12845 [Rhodomicrobium sp.]